jgi:K+/H+ antiporter YhaU regulatory subunit KhtT
MLAVSKQDGSLLLMPDEHSIMEAGDNVVVVGLDEHIRRLEN